MALSEARQFYEIIANSKTPLIALSKQYNADAHAAGLALFSVLQKLGARPELFSPGLTDKHVFSFLPTAENLKNKIESTQKTIISFPGLKQHPRIEHKIDERGFHIHVFTDNAGQPNEGVKISEKFYRHDLMICLGLPDLESIGEFFDLNTDFFYRTPIVNVDHSPENEHFGQLNVINLTATSISELLYELFAEIDQKLMDENIATCLLAGMIEKTKSFKSPRVTPRSLQIASNLMAGGANRENIVRNLYQTKSVNVLKLWGRILMKLATNETSTVASAEISPADFQETGTDESALPALLEELFASVPTVELSALFYERDNRKFCLVQTERNIDLRPYFSHCQISGTKTRVLVEFTGENNAFLQELNKICS